MIAGNRLLLLELQMTGSNLPHFSIYEGKNKFLSYVCFL